jgi:hypothetical protein
MKFGMNVMPLETIRTSHILTYRIGNNLIPDKDKTSYFLYSVQNGSGAHPVSYPMDSGGVPLSQGCEADHLSPSTANVNMCGAIPLRLMRLIEWCLLDYEQRKLLLELAITARRYLIVGNTFGLVGTFFFFHVEIV